jgi:hypothetical protein
MLFDVWAYLNDGSVPMPGWNDRGVPAALVGQSHSGGWTSAGWRTDAYEFIIEPNPRWEKIGLKFRRMGVEGPFEVGAYIDQVVIDTICPEPASLALLAFGGLALLRRRRGA